MANQVGATSGSNHERTSSMCRKNPCLGWNEFRCFFDLMYPPLNSIDMICKCRCLCRVCQPRRSSTSVNKNRMEEWYGQEKVETAHTGGA